MLNISDQKKFLRGTPRHLALLGELRPGAVLSINNTTRRQCGFNCLHCGNKNAPKATKKLNLEEIKNLLNSAKRDFNTKTLILPGEGDPLLDKNFKKIVAHAFGLGMTTYVFNTMDQITESLAHFCLERDVTFIISFTDANEESYDHFVRQKGAYKKVMRNIRMLAEVYADAVREEKGKQIYRLAFNTDVNFENKDRRGAVQKLARKLGFMSILNYPWLAGEAVVNAEELLGKQAKPTGVNNELTKIVFSESENGGMSFLGLDGFCGVESLGLSIGIDGRLQQCPYRINQDQKMGHINDYKTKEGYDLKRALKEKLYFWEKNKVKICSLRHGGSKFEKAVKNF